MLFSLLVSVLLAASPATYVVDSLATSDPARMLVLRSDRSWALEPRDSAGFDSDTRLAILFEGKFCCPLQARVFTPFGEIDGLQHTGVDVATKAGRPVSAAFDGIVTLSSDNHPAYGGVIRIQHPAGLETLYANVRALRFSEGAEVHAGDVIAEADSLSGAGPHLHFELRYDGLALDPARVFDFPAGLLKVPFCIIDRSHLAPVAQHHSASVGEQREIYLAQVARIAEQERLAEEERQRLARMEAAARKYHTVRSGETLSRIAAKYHTSVRALCRLNGINEKTTLRVGRSLRVK